jgi:hypothetical protein
VADVRKVVPIVADRTMEEDAAFITTCDSACSQANRETPFWRLSTLSIVGVPEKSWVRRYVEAGCIGAIRTLGWRAMSTW